MADQISADDCYDLIVIGSGVAGMVAAITAARHGLRALIIEKEPLWGGVSSYSGGYLWVPNHHLMAKDGHHDSEALALTYMNKVIGEVSPASSAARRLAYVRNAARVVKTLEDDGYEWGYAQKFPDYYMEEHGGSDNRGVVAAAFDGKKLGPWFATMCRPNNFPPIVIDAWDALALLTPFSHIGTVLKVVARTLWWRLLGRAPLGAGQALVARLMIIVQRYGVEVRLNAPLKELQIENGKVVGVVAGQNGQQVTLRARAGVVLAAGGFARNDAFRRRYQPVGSGYTAAMHAGDTGDAIQIGMALGAATALMEHAWWMSTVILPDGDQRMLLWERALPYSMIVDQLGRRFVNESRSYNDLGRTIIEHSREAPATPSWLIMDARHRRRYAFQSWPGGYTPQKMINAGFFTKADSLADLARQCDIDAATLQATVDRFNGFARSGIDEDFGRGNTSFDRAWGDPACKPNPNLGTIERAPFWAVKVYPGDLGTKGGLLTNEHARVLKENSEPIAGLYACGNTSASVMGTTYPGPGSTLGAAAVFAQLAVEHAASRFAGKV